LREKPRARSEKKKNEQDGDGIGGRGERKKSKKTLNRRIPRARPGNPSSLYMSTRSVLLPDGAGGEKKRKKIGKRSKAVSAIRRDKVDHRPHRRKGRRWGEGKKKEKN